MQLDCDEQLTRRRIDVDRIPHPPTYLHGALRLRVPSVVPQRLREVHRQIPAGHSPSGFLPAVERHTNERGDIVTRKGVQERQRERMMILAILLVVISPLIGIGFVIASVAILALVYLALVNT